PNYGVPPSILTRNPLSRVVLFDHHDKGLEAAISICINDVVMEVRGKMMLMEEYEHICDPISVYNRFAIMYRGVHERGIVIDCAQFGNDARFIRRSCNPNCKLDHVTVSGKLHVIIRTICEICPGTELTLPFDIDYRALHYPVECACARSRCSVYKWSKKLMKNKVIPTMDYSKYIEGQLKMLSRPLVPDSSWPEPLQLTATGLTTASQVASRNSNQASSPIHTPVKTTQEDENHHSPLISKTFVSTPKKNAVVDLTDDEPAKPKGRNSRVTKRQRVSEEQQLAFQPIITTRRHKTQTQH
ncbi:Glucose-induced degradation complex subunit, partial [Cichlidogyrus casuarinus]